MNMNHSTALPWSVFEEDEKRFRKILAITLGLVVVGGLIMPFLPIFTKPVEKIPQLPPPVARLIYEKPVTVIPMPEEITPVIEAAVAEPTVEPTIEPAPEAVVKPVPEIVTEPETVTKPKPEAKVTKQPKAVKPKAKKRVAIKKKQPPRATTISKTEQARKKARSVGLLAMSDSLSNLRQNNNIKTLTSRSSLTKAGATATATTAVATGQLDNSKSQGIDDFSPETQQSQTQLAARKRSRVKNSLAKQAATVAKKQRKSHTGGRSDITRTFDKNKRILNNIYNRALRKNPALQGKFVIRLTISPSGNVTDIKLVSSELDDPALERKLLQRIKMYKFGAMNVSETTKTFSIDFFPG